MFEHECRSLRNEQRWSYIPGYEPILFNLLTSLKGSQRESTKHVVAFLSCICLIPVLDTCNFTPTTDHWHTLTRRPCPFRMCLICDLKTYDRELKPKQKATASGPLAVASTLWSWQAASDGLCLSTSVTWPCWRWGMEQVEVLGRS